MPQSELSLADTSGCTVAPLARAPLSAAAAAELAPQLKALADPVRLRLAVRAMAEVGIDISSQQPKALTYDAVETSDVVITMGCGDSCPSFPGVRYLDWVLTDPAGKGVEAVRPIRDEIEQRVRGLLAELSITPVSQ